MKWKKKIVENMECMGMHKRKYIEMERGRERESTWERQHQQGKEIRMLPKAVKFYEW